MPNSPRHADNQKLTTSERIMRIETQLNDHLADCEKSNARVSRILFIGLAAVIGVAAFGMAALYNNVNSQSQEIRRMLTSAQTQAAITAGREP